MLNQILGTDFPDQWPNYLEGTVALLQSPEINSVYAGLVCLLELSRVYRWRSKDRRKGLDHIIEVTFPSLLRLGESLVNEDSDLAGDMMRMILKIYKSVIWLELPSELQNMSSLVPWGQILLKTVTKTPPVQAMTQDIDARETHIWWKAKKWAYFCLDRLFQRYGDPTQLGGEAAQDYGEFSKVFSSSFAPEILKCYLSQVQNWAADKNQYWLSPRAMFFIGSFLTSCVKPKSTWALLKDNVDSLVEHFVFPQIQHTTSDLELWDFDPQEYISKRIDIYDDYSSPDVAAINFLVACCARKKSTCFVHSLAFINRELTHYLEGPVAERNPIRKEAALRMTGNLSHIILKGKSPVKSMMEQFFATHVFPEFDSPQGYLRARACEMMNRFADIEYKNQENLAIAYQGVLKCLTENELPVRVEAALALQPLIRQDFVHNAMVESIPQIMKVLLQLANEVDVDSLSNVMEEFVEVFANELTPYAVELAEQLRDTFLRIMQDSVESQGLGPEDAFDWDNMDDKSLAALGILNTIGTLILSLENTPEALFRLEETVLPVINLVLHNEIIDLYAEVFEIIDSCTFSSKAISPTMWEVYGTLYKTFKESGMEYIDELLPSLENYLAFGANVLIENQDYQAMMFDIIQTVLTNDRLGVQDRLAATKLSHLFLLSLKGYVDQYLHPLMSIVLARLSDPKDPKIGSYKILLVETIVIALYYNPLAAIQFLENNGGTATFFNLWLSSLEEFKRVHDKKLVILTIVSLLNLSVEDIPESVRPGWPQLSTALLTTFNTFPEAVARREAAQQKLSNEDSDYWKNDLEEDENDDDEVDEWDETAHDDGEQEDEAHAQGNEYLDFLGAEAKRLAKQVNDSEEDAEDYDDDQMAEDVLFVSPLEKIDPYSTTKSFFQTLHEKNPTMYEQLTQTWSDEQRAQFQSIMTIANTTETMLAK